MHSIRVVARLGLLCLQHQRQPQQAAFLQRSSSSSLLSSTSKRRHLVQARALSSWSTSMAPNQDASGVSESAAADGIPVLHNVIGGTLVPPSLGRYLDVDNPATGQVIGKVALSNAQDVEAAVQAAQDALDAWSNGMTFKTRCAILLKFHALVQQHAEELAALIVEENGKNWTEALADVAKGNETVEYAASLALLAKGNCMTVSRGGVVCADRRTPLGVVASIVPFNFPFMVPHWTLPIALVCGNTLVLKPSERVPKTMQRVMDLLTQAGVPPGVVNLVHGTRDAVEAIMDHPKVSAVTFVGSSQVAKLVAERCHGHHKRVVALGGAKNHLVALEDCHVESTATDVVVSYAGCAGQRCMAASVLLLVGQQDELLQQVVAKAAALQPGTGPGQMGPVISAASRERIVRYIELAEQDGAQVLLDGRQWKAPKEGGGNWIGPTILLHQQPTDVTMREEVFGPVLSVYRVSSWQEAIDIENANPHGNAASVYTTHGGSADWFLDRFQAAMLGVNIGIPVPREPFSFGGLYGTLSKYGDGGDITGDAGLEFFTTRRKITSRWPAPPQASAAATTAATSISTTTDHAHFSGKM